MTPRPETASDLAESPSVRMSVHSDECLPPVTEAQRRRVLQKIVYNNHVNILVRGRNIQTDSAL